MKNDDMDIFIDRLLAEHSVSVSEDFVDRTLEGSLSPSRAELEARVDALLRRREEFQTPGFTERVIGATFGAAKRGWGGFSAWRAGFSAAVLASAAALAITLAHFVPAGASEPPTVGDYEKMCSIIDDINNITYLVLEEERFDMLRF